MNHKEILLFLWNKTNKMSGYPGHPIVPLPSLYVWLWGVGVIRERAVAQILFRLF
jgi:hypothetical protein